MNYEYDLIVIGSGPAGEKGAAAAAYFHKRVALIEKEDHYGGAAANTGTLPSKTLRETAVVLSGLKQRKLLGLTFNLEERVNIQDFLSHERRVKDLERIRIINNFNRHQIRIFRGNAAFVDEHTVAVCPQRCDPMPLTAEKILIATGSYPYRPKDLFPFTNPRIFDSDTILSLYEIPTSMLVVGGGVIGCEYACIFAALGVEVTLVEKGDRLLGGIDREISELMREQLKSVGINVLLKNEVASISSPDRDAVEVALKNGGVLTVHSVLVSSGRSGQTAGLGLDRLQVALNKRGQIMVNELYQVKRKDGDALLDHIYAAGDVIGNPALASTAMAQARMAIAHAFGLPFNTGLTEVLPVGIYTIPECSSAGATEEELQAKGVPYIAGRARYRDNARGQIIGDKNGLLKLLFREDDMTLLGVHILGEQATELVHVGLTALLVKSKVDLFIHTCYNYPTLTELYKYAAYDALINKAKKQGTPPPEVAHIQRPPQIDGNGADHRV
jgi:NAD(P) transhydrogenase